MLNRLLVNNYYKIIISLVLLFYTISCIPIWEKINSVSLQDIQNRKKLKVIASYNQNTYYIYREQEMGFEFELIKLFCKEIGVELEITTTKDLDNLPFMLNSTDNDLVMGNLLVNRKKARELSYTEHLQTSRMVLVQRSKLYAKKEVYINNVVQLIGKKIYLRKKSSYYSKIKSLQEELGGKIDIEVVEGDISTEELIEKVSNGEIDYTISDEPTAQISMTYYNNLDSAVVVSFPQKISWIVRRNSPELLREMNKWILKIRSDGTLDKIKTKYYLSSRYTKSDNQVITYLKQSENKSISGGRISPYDKIFQVESEKLGWDWRLLAALCYTESKFNPEAK